MRGIRTFLLLFFLLALTPGYVHAASISLTPATGIYSIGDLIEARVVVSSPAVAVNAISGLISFPTDKLSVVSVSKTGSIVSLWVQEPSFSNSAGTVQLEGVVLNPGFTGQNGRVLTITFRARAAGPATVMFRESAVLANDGSGTNVLQDYRSAVWTIGGVETRESALDTETATEIANTPKGIPVVSSTHPDPTQWYSLKTAEVSWALPEGTTAVRTQVDRNPRSIPSVLYQPPVTSRTLENLDDGIWYFHLQGRNKDGWGGITHFPVRIDTIPPSVPTLKVIESTDPSNPIQFLEVLSQDERSGISHYLVKVGELEYQRYDAPVRGGAIRVPLLLPGMQVVIVKAVDMAGNQRLNTDEINVVGLEPPHIKFISNDITEGDAFIVKGTTYPNSEVMLFLKKDGREEIYESAVSDDNGEFSHIWTTKLDGGVYTFTAHVMNQTGAESPRTRPQQLMVRAAVIFRIGSFIVTAGSLIGMVAVVILGLITLGTLIVRRFQRFRKIILSDVDAVDRGVHRSFDLLKDDLQNEMRALEKVKTRRQLTLQEERLLEKFSENVDQAESFIEKKISDVKKDIGM